jgi:hypothetical protein
MDAPWDIGLVISNISLVFISANIPIANLSSTPDLRFEISADPSSTSHLGSFSYPTSSGATSAPIQPALLATSSAHSSQSDVSASRSVSRRSFAPVLAPAEDLVGGISSLEENIGAMDAHVAAMQLTDGLSENRNNANKELGKYIIELAIFYL